MSDGATARAAGEPVDRRSTVLTTRDRMAAGLLILAGWTLIYLVLFDQGATLDLLLGSAVVSGDGGVFHELFHDGRHLGLVPCH